MIKITRNKVALGVLVTLMSLTSCQDYLDIEPKDKLNSDQVYRDVFDADAVVVGIYGKFMGLAKKYIILNELRADLMSPTANADMYLQQISEHAVTADNPYANPKDFYEVINNCNDALKNFKIMVDENKMDQGEFNERYSDIGTLRSWLYLQLGMHYGEVPYITEPISDIDDVQNENLYPRLSLTELINELVDFTEGLPYTSPYSANSTLVIDVDGYNTAKFFINKECLLGDLQLWANHYTQAAAHYKTVMETGSTGADAFYYDTYRVIYTLPNTVDIGIEYERNQEQDVRSLISSNSDGWRSIFAREQDARWNNEWIWSLPFDSNFAPQNPFIDLFSNQGGDYLVKPSQEAMDLWDGEAQRNGFSYDARGSKVSYHVINGQPVIMKYLFKYLDTDSNLPFDVFQTGGDWFLYRAATLHLRYAEAANRDNQHRIADALLNFGLQSAYTVDGVTDVTDIEQTHQPFPYDFDARQGDFPFFRGPWYRNNGLRGRAFVERAEVLGDSLTSIENNLIKESGLELAYEGNRWGDLVRVALRRNDPAFLADKVYEKLYKDGNPKADEVRSKLMNTDNWYLPFVWKEDE
ncbi:RagB/SusD family nutrient uptake outer membrane protein [Aestuariibaculum suncheonense]|uniref:RagB/SusD family nutrient uptake outer membrane protein n=1 Tax=Aestuariibaculum suncheonense TaxID=1028745 RepID=A0A8J6UG81_9FLAO|nr:RagB/SusD family nutrient uptake outer membrane protein [Aestuariibaculum suncheonense]MBD0834824.1 RagB/SusD family nutrient uptake outer membrane protein [Aestuariibaculum suncheonense]